MGDLTVGRIEQLTHTPGPWRASATVRDVTLGAFHAVHPPDGHAPVAYVATAHDAALIAAAPELYAALKELLADIEDYQRLNHLGGESNHAQQMARAAIQKVEGR